jgi:hypothetical protein
LSCSANCKSCKATGCTQCNSGYFLNINSTCTKICNNPCNTCLKSDPTKCTSCIKGYIYNNGTNSCTPQTACSGNCTVCPLNFVLSNGLCV